jgi:acyl dehydratase
MRFVYREISEIAGHKLDGSHRVPNPENVFSQKHMACSNAGSRRTDMAFRTPQEDRYFEDYIPGAVHEFGSIVAEEAEMIAFARRFDPQPFHIDPVAAKQSVFGGLIASGWYSASLMMRLYVDHYLSHVASLSSPGVDELRWLRPVRPDDTLSLRITVSGTKLSRSKPDRGVVHSYIEVLNQHKEVVMTMKAMNLLGRREMV